MTALRLALGYFHPWPNDSGFLLAQAEGWFADAGVDLVIGTADPLRGDALQAVVDGTADLAVAPTNRLLVRREHGEDLVAVAALNHTALETIQTLGSTGIRRPRDLAGRRIALNPTPRGLAMVGHLVARDGGDPDAVVVVDSGARELDVADLAAGAADATFGGYWAWDVLLARPVPGDDHVVWRVDELGAPPFQPYLLVARGAAVRDAPEALRAVLDVARRGFERAAVDHVAVRTVLERAVPYFPPGVLARSLELIAPTWTHDGVWGRPRPELLGPYARWLRERGILREEATWAAATTDALLG